MDFVILLSFVSSLISLFLLYKIYSTKDGTNLEKSINEQIAKENRYMREEITNHFKNFNDTLLKVMTELNTLQKNQLESFASQLKDNFELFNKNIEKLNESLNQNLKQNREDISKSIKELQTENTKKLDEMRVIVDEKLQDTLNKRLNESFKQVGDRLEQVHKGLGEMQVLATGVGDLKKILGNVKTKGIIGEYQLSAILEHMLAPDQYEKDKITKEGTRDHVEFVIKLPGREEGKYVYLPIDSKFPTEDYQNLQDAYNEGDIKNIEENKKKLVNTVKLFAKTIKEKYIDPPNTTDFAIMFLPFEGLYAEVLRQNGLFESIQREYRVNIAGPTTLSAFLNSLQIGFKTLMIEKRSSDVWRILNEVKTEFSKFGVVLNKVKDKLKQAENDLDNVVGTRTRVLERKLNQIEDVNGGETAKIDLIDEELLL